MTSRTLIFDVMSTLVVDPFFTEVPIAFGCSIADFVRGHSRSAWPAFERNELTEEGFFRQFFGANWRADGDKMRSCITQGYRYIDGIEELLGELNQAAEVRDCVALSNYPIWFEVLEERLQLSRYLRHSYVSYQLGLRKPDPEIYLAVLEHLGVAAQRCIFIDDRQENCEAANALGMTGLLFTDVSALRAELTALAIL